MSVPLQGLVHKPQDSRLTRNAAISTEVMQERC